MSHGEPLFKRRSSGGAALQAASGHTACHAALLRDRQTPLEKWRSDRRKAALQAAVRKHATCKVALRKGCP